jgi:hypothetical protein
MELEATRRKLLLLLRQPSLIGIRFRYAGSGIDHAAWNAVHYAITRRRIEVCSAGLTSDSAYSPSDDKFYLQPTLLTIPALEPGDQATAAHELAHAAVDVQAVSSLSSADSEVIAFVVEEAFRIRAGLPNQGYGILDNVSYVPAERSLLCDALLAARSLAGFVLAHPGATLPAPVAQLVRDGLWRHPKYRQQFEENPVASNGLTPEMVS